VHRDRVTTGLERVGELPRYCAQPDVGAGVTDDIDSRSAVHRDSTSSIMRATTLDIVLRRVSMGISIGAG